MHGSTNRFFIAKAFEIITIVIVSLLQAGVDIILLNNEFFAIILYALMFMLFSGYLIFSLFIFYFEFFDKPLSFAVAHFLYFAVIVLASNLAGAGLVGGFWGTVAMGCTVLLANLIVIRREFR